MKPLTPAEQYDEEQIQAAFQRLLDTYIASNHRKKTEIITKAFNFAKASHKGVRRRSGEPYILHPIAVAQIICGEIGLGSTSICAALLHDVIEDTDYTRDDIANLFGEKVANIVEGVTKVASGLLSNKASSQAETFKKILLTMSDDIRVILVKIADRLHNMRTLSSMPPSKQYKIVGETLYIFAPLADRLGLNRIKTELEDLSFKYEHPDDYQQMLDNLKRSEMERDDAFSDFTPAIRSALDAMGVDYEIRARIKSPYSIWQKMQRKQVPFEEVFDILAIRIVFRPKNRKEEIAECYSIYAALTQIYKPHPSRFRDWLSTPKANGYQALHNTFMSHRGKWIEVQIRSDRMDDMAEGGFAAHWKYKDQGSHYDERELDTWVNSIKEILDDPQPDTLDLLDTIKLNLFASELNVFTPKGEIITLPQGATVLDFAFAIHTMIGSHCLGAKVNHHLVPISHKLSSGDQIEIITSQTQNIQPEWLNYVTTGKAKGKIAAALRKEAREHQREGEELLRTFLQKNDYEANAANIQRITAFHHYPTTNELFQAIAEQHLQLGQAELDMLAGKKPSTTGGWRRFVPFLKPKTATPSTPSEGNIGDMTTFLKGLNRKQTLRLNNELIDRCVFCPECHPIHGDEVMGYITPDNQLELHRRECAVALKHKTRFGNNILATQWDDHATPIRFYDTQIYLEGVDSKAHREGGNAQGVLHSISEILAEFPQFYLRGISLTARDGIFQGRLILSLHTTHDIRQVCHRLLAIPQITKAVREG